MTKHYWVVHTTEDVTYTHKHNNQEYTYKKNESYGTIADSIESAIAAVRRDHPNCVVWRVNHQGQIKVEQ
jgi:broad specificity phosphatase PhoE